MSADRSASVLARLLNRSRSTGENYNLLLSRFAIERLLYRLSVSPHAGTFVLKGALLFALWFDSPHRPTKDADLLGFGADDADTLRSTFTEICAIDADDGVRYESASMRIAPIREDNVYGGLRLTIPAFIGSARLPVQVRRDHARARDGHLPHVARRPGSAIAEGVSRLHGHRGEAARDGRAGHEQQPDEGLLRPGSHRQNIGARRPYAGGRHSRDVRKAEHIAAYINACCAVDRVLVEPDQGPAVAGLRNEGRPSVDQPRRGG